jgi:uncharacterized damage-inducible protein DinB
MSTSMLEDAFGHHVWATLRVIDACLPLNPGQLETAVPGTYGSILSTIRHLVGGDAWYLFALTRGRSPEIEEDQLGLPELRAAMERNGDAWARIVGEEPNPDTVLVSHSSDGFETHAPVSIRITQALHHGTDHRSQICTTLTMLGVEPPGIDVWDFGFVNGRVTEIPPPTS